MSRNRVARTVDWGTYTLAILVSIVIVLGVAIMHPDSPPPSEAPTTTEAPCTEDMQCWNCETMGNGLCGPQSTIETEAGVSVLTLR